MEILTANYDSEQQSGFSCSKHLIFQQIYNLIQQNYNHPFLVLYEDPDLLGLNYLFLHLNHFLHPVSL